MMMMAMMMRMMTTTMMWMMVMMWMLMMIHTLFVILGTEKGQHIDYSFHAGLKLSCTP